jgi:hypothetical protein
MKKILENIKIKEEKIEFLQKVFWKLISAEVLNESKVIECNSDMVSQIEECKILYNNTIATSKSDSLVLRAYGKFLENFLYEKEEAEEFYQKALEAEEEELRKRRRNSSIVDRKKSYFGDNSELELKSKASMGKDFENASVDDEKFESISEFGDGLSSKQNKQKEFYRTSINSKQPMTYFLIICLISILSIIILLIIEDIVSQSGDSIHIIGDICQVTPLIYMGLSNFRFSQTVSIFIFLKLFFLNILKMKYKFK